MTDNQAQPLGRHVKILVIGQGYIGSYLTLFLRGAGHEVTVCSTSFGLPDARTVRYVARRYQDLDADFLASFDRILWFAGHSSVGKAIADPAGAIRNNCFDLIELARRKPGCVPMIYASTASLYSVSHDAKANEAPTPRGEDEALISSLNAYDSSKAAFDALVGPLAQNTCGLRLGTLCGHSPNLRGELVFNSMNLSAMNSRKVKVANRSVWRSLLFLEDLSQALVALLQYNELPHRFINLASLDIQIGDLADQIAAFHKVKIEVLPDTSTYSFRMDTDLMGQVAGPLPHRTIADRCDDFVRKISQTDRPVS